LAASSIRVLVVDDYEQFRRFLSSALQCRADIKVIGEASNGLEAVGMTEELKPDLILLDIGLPSLNGIEAARRIRSISPKSKIIFVSQESSADIVQQAFSLGACGYVVKTDAGRELLAAVTAVLRGERFVGIRFAGHNFTGASDSLEHPAWRYDTIASGEMTQLPNAESTRRHEVLFHSDDTWLLDNVTQFVGTALNAGNSAVILATEAHRDGFLPRLQAHGINISAAIKQGRYFALDASENLSRFMVNDAPDTVRFFEALGSLIATAARAAKGERARVAIFGECVQLLWAQGNAEAAIQIEKLGNQLASVHNVDIMCGYSLASFQGGMDTHIFQRICAEHSAVHSQ
jgi:DNA-binding NarL/FixJ family response regulator